LTLGETGETPMLFVWMGFFKEGAGPVPQKVQQQATAFLQQPFVTIRSVGQLRDASGNHSGMMMLFDVEDRAAAEALVKTSPYLNAGLYDDHRLYEFVDEIG
jgi:uncharacterized protein YciI